MAKREYHNNQPLENDSGHKRRISYSISSGLAHVQFSSVRLLSRVRLFVTPWTVPYKYIVHCNFLVLKKKSKHEDFNWIFQITQKFRKTHFDTLIMWMVIRASTWLHRWTHSETHGWLVKAGGSSWRRLCTSLCALSLCSLQLHLLRRAARNLLTGSVS